MPEYKSKQHLLFKWEEQYDLEVHIMKQSLFEESYIKLIRTKKEEHEADAVGREDEIYWENCIIASSSTIGI